MKLGMQVGLSPGHIMSDGDPAPPPPNGHSHQFSAHICCGQMAAWIKMPLGTEVSLGPGDFVLDEDPAPGGPPQKEGGARPKFSALVLWSNGWMDQDGACTEVALSSGDFLLDGDLAPSPKRRRSPLPKFSAHFYCGQRAGWIKMALGMEVGLGPGHIFLDGDLAPLPKKGTEPIPNFRTIYIVAKRLDASRCHLVWR